jgi:hypothetical protein
MGFNSTVDFLDGARSLKTKVNFKSSSVEPLISAFNKGVETMQQQQTKRSIPDEEWFSNSVARNHIAETTHSPGKFRFSNNILY